MGFETFQQVPKPCPKCSGGYEWTMETRGC